MKQKLLFILLSFIVIPIYGQKQKVPEFPIDSSTGKIVYTEVIYLDSTVSKVDLFIPTIHCASCIWLLENLHTLNPGVVYSNVNFPKKLVSITYKEKQVSQSFNKK